jgi:HAD superfamily 5'-nucleotidase-like hydrolase
MSVYINRTLNMKHIKAIGFDMDYTLVRYHSDAFEALTHSVVKNKLIQDYGYPDECAKFKFDFHRAIRGLVLDKETGNILKVSTYGKIKQSYHGLSELDYKAQQKCYQGLTVDLNDDRYRCIDTSFSIAHAVLFAQMIDLKEKKPELKIKSFYEVERDIMDAVDLAHRDNSLKSEVRKNPAKYIISDKDSVATLERLKLYGKKLWVITNSDFDYTKALLDYAINPHLKKYTNWQELFDLTVTSATKPRFFTDKNNFLKIHPESGLMSNTDGKLTHGIYQGGNAIKIQKDFGILGDEILYLGDHIYGDILKLKKTCNWRTALVIEELVHEVDAYNKARKINDEIYNLMQTKIKFEKEVDILYAKEIEESKKPSKTELQKKFKEVEKIDQKLAALLKKHNSFYNSHWGEVMRAGVEPSYFAGQIEKYACIYMSKIADLNQYTPRTYFRPKKRTLAHEH